MERREFLETLGLGAAFVLTATCLYSCSNNNSALMTPTTGTDLATVDLTLASNAALTKKGGYIVTNGIVVAQDTSGNYVAATQTCTHENLVQIYYDSASNSYMCSAHGAHYTLGGVGLNSNGAKGIAVYKTSLVGNILHVTA